MRNIVHRIAPEVLPDEILWMGLRSTENIKCMQLHKQRELHSQACKRAFHMPAGGAVHSVCLT